MARSHGGLCVVAGETSGDLQASLIVPLIKKYLEEHFQQEIPVWGGAGPALRAQGVEAVLRIEDLAVMGLAEIIGNYPKISSLYKEILHVISVRRPVAVVLIDYPGFNLRLAADCHALGLTVIYHIPPKVWAHGAKRVEILKAYCHLVTTILPFENKFLTDAKVPSVFVGNPLRDSIKAFKKNARQNPEFPKGTKIGLLPGSRKSEIKFILPTLVKAFFALKAELSAMKMTALLPVASGLDENLLREVVKMTASQIGVTAPFEDILIAPSQGYRVMLESDYAWVGSGTATLEAAFFHLPMAVVYKMNPVTFAIAKRLVKVSHVGLVNLCSGESSVPEFLQEQANEINLVKHAKSLLLNTEASDAMKASLCVLEESFPLHSEVNAATCISQAIIEYSGLSFSQKNEKQNLRSVKYLRR